MRSTRETRDPRTGEARTGEAPGGKARSGKGPGSSPALAIAALVVAALAVAADFATSPARTGSPDTFAAPEQTATPRAAAAPIPEGAELELRLDQPLSTEGSEPGDRWSGTLTHDVTNGDRVLVKRGARVTGVVTHSGPAEVDGATRQVLAVQPKELQVRDRRYKIAADVVDAELHEPDETITGENLAIIGGSVGAGAVLGELLLDEALLGAVLGAAGGTAIALATEETEIELQEGSTLTVRLKEELKVAGPIPGAG